MINDFIKAIIIALDTVYQSTGISDLIADLLQKLNTPFQYQVDFAHYLQGVYFIFGKPLVMWCIGVAVVIIVIRLATAIINLIWP